MQSTKNLLEGRNGPITQSVGAVKNLLAFVGRSADPLPTDVSLDNGRLVLVLSNKRDTYYTLTARACSCPGNQFRHNCKHIRKYFPQEQAATKPAATGSLIKHGGFKPFDEMSGEEKARASSLSAIDCHDTSGLDVAYWSIQEDKIMWPALGEA
ncbi:MAG: hypothetical protein E4G89_01710 [Methanothrix sp.]|nr:MAG: hypothetical protein E4G89_01710 [Methanothrix sp.]